MRKENGGKSTALNVALPLVETEYVWIFDDDDVAMEHALASHVAALDAHPERVFTFGPAVYAHSEGAGELTVAMRDLWPEFRDEELVPRVLEGCFIRQQGMLTRTRRYREVGPYDTELVRSQDYDMILRLIRGQAGVRINEPTYYYRAHAQTRGDSVQRFRFEERFERWQEYDRIVFRKVRREWGLADYLPLGTAPDGELSPGLRRQARLQLFAALALHGYWEAALDELERMADRPECLGPLTEAERGIAGRSMSEVGSVVPLVEDRRVGREFGKLWKRLPDRDLRRGLARGLYWIAKRKKNGLTGIQTASCWSLLLRLAATGRM
jgi:hypothetical protein